MRLCALTSYMPSSLSSLYNLFSLKPRLCTARQSFTGESGHSERQNRHTVMDCVASVLKTGFHSIYSLYIFKSLFSLIFISNKQPIIPERKSLSQRYRHFQLLISVLPSLQISSMGVHSRSLHCVSLPRSPESHAKPEEHS